VVFGVVECQGGLQGVGGSGESVGHWEEHRVNLCHVDRSGSLIKGAMESSGRERGGHLKEHRLKSVPHGSSWDG
jgi:hypothetical protein